MAKNNSSPRGELSYYGLSLLSYLSDSHPELTHKAGAEASSLDYALQEGRRRSHKTEDKSFITKRADLAAGVYSEAIQNGLTHIEAEELANAELYRDLHFSAYNTLVNILWDEFPVEIPEDAARKVALQVLPLCGNVLAKYPLGDDFADTPAYDLLYTELVGTIEILLEDGAI